MKIAHVCIGRPDPNGAGGGQVYYWQTLEALTWLGHEVHLIVCDGGAAVPRQVAALCGTVTYVDTLAPTRRSLDYLVARVFRSETLPFRFPDWGGVRSQVAAALARISPDVIWAEHVLGMLAVPDGWPIVYAHHDFLHKLQPVRDLARGRRLRRPDAVSHRRLEALERAACRRATVAVSVSATETPVLEGLGVRTRYLPVVGQHVPPPTTAPREVPRAYLFGRSNTAMNAQRRTLRDDIWPHLPPTPLALTWHQVGEPPARPDDAWRWLAAHFHLHGFIDELSSVFRPGDLCLIPYREDTGFRVKLVTAAAHGLVNIGYEQTFRCAPEFVPGENCLAARSGAHFAELLAQYAEDPDLRARLTLASRATYDARLTPAAQRPIYEAVLVDAWRGSTVG